MPAAASGAAAQRRAGRRAADCHDQPHRAGRQQDVGEVVLEDLVRLESAVPRAGQWQALQTLLVESEADRLVPEVAGRGEHDGGHQHERHDGAGADGATRTAPPGLERHSHQRGQPEVDTEHDRQSRQRTGGAGAPAGQQQRAEAERQRGRVGVRDAGVRHGGDDGEPRRQRQRLRGVAADQRVGEHGNACVERHPHDPPHEQRGSEQRVQAAEQEVLARPVVRVEVAVRKLTVRDPLRRLEHQALVVWVDPPSDRQPGQQPAEHEQPEHRRGTSAPGAREAASPRVQGAKRMAPRGRRG